MTENSTVCGITARYGPEYDALLFMIITYWIDEKVICRTSNKQRASFVVCIILMSKRF